MNRVIVTRPICGLLYCQVCAVRDAPDEEVLEVANRENLCGTTLGWCVVARENHEKEALRPVPCQDDPERIHLMLIC